MTYGIYAKNDSGYTQIDQTTQGFQVLATGTVAASGMYTVNYVTIPASYPDDILVVAKPSSPNLTLDYRLYARYEDITVSGTRTRRCYMNFAYGNVVLAMAAADYAIIQRCSLFDDSAISGQTPPNYGLNVYQANGTLSFTTEHPTFRVQAARHQEITSTNSGAGVWYNGVDSTDMQYIYCLAMGYGPYYKRVFGPSIDREYVNQSRLGQFDFPNNRFATYIQGAGGSTNAQAATGTWFWEGHRTEMVGYIV